MTEIKVLDKGFVRLVDSMGNDAAIVQAARVSYGEGTKSIREDHRLIDYLYRHGHTSPFEQCVFKFHIKLPIFVMRQLVRYRTARLNEVSARYSELPNEFYIPQESRISGQVSTNKQGSGALLEPEVRIRVVQEITVATQQAYDSYKRLLADGVARETARLVLPVSIYTECYWQMDLNNLFKFLALRLDEHTQVETRDYAQAIADVVKTHCPAAFAAFEEHTLKVVPT